MNELFTFNTGVVYYAMHAKHANASILWSQSHEIESDKYCTFAGDETIPNESQVFTRKITVILDTKVKQLSFAFDGINKGIAFENLRTSDDMIYRLAVSVLKPGDNVELLNLDNSE